MVSASHDAAPGRLETVRALLNTWLIPNDTRVGTDRLPDLSRDAGRWAAELPHLPRPETDTDVEELRQTRDALRTLVDDPASTADTAAWLALAVDRHAVSVVPELTGGRLTVALRPRSSADASAEVLAAVLEAAHDRTWSRLKSCLDCRWAFYDHSRSATRKWCGMNAVGTNGRACGSIAKVRAYRSRQAQVR